MRAELIEFVDAIKADRDRLPGFDEAATKQFIVQRLLHLLGWDIFNELVPEYQVGGGRVDFAVQREGVNRIFIEVKRIGIDLEEVQDQLLRYAFQEGVRLGALTNGVAWWLYLPLLEGSWEQRRFFAIDLLQQDTNSVADNFIRFLESDRVVSGEAITSAEEYSRSRQRQAILEKTMPLAWNKIVSEPDELLLDLLIETAESLSGYRAEQEMAATFMSRHAKQLLVPEPRDRVGLPSITPPTRPAKQTRIIKPADFTGTKPKSFRWAGASYEVGSWKDFLFRISDLLYQEDPDRFYEVSLSLKGRKRPYFALNPEDLRIPKELGQTGILVETNISAQSVVAVCRSLLALFDYNPDDLIITLE
jgi:hypothetical protein